MSRRRKFSTKPIRGMREFYPSELKELQWVEGIIRDISDLYCYDEFKAPIIEPVEIFAAKSSDELVNEQSFTIEKKKGERLILSPELTPSLARMITNKSQELKGNITSILEEKEKRQPPSEIQRNEKTD